MTMRIREQMERLGNLKTKCTLTVSALPIELAPLNPGAGLEEQVQNVADRVTQMIMTRMERNHTGAKKGAKTSH